VARQTGSAEDGSRHHISTFTQNL